MHDKAFNSFLRDIEQNGPTHQRLGPGTLYDYPRRQMELFWTNIWPDSEAEKAEYERAIRAAEKRYRRGKSEASAERIAR